MSLKFTWKLIKFNRLHDIMGYQVDKSAPKVINRDFSKNEFFPLWHPVLPTLSVFCAAKSTSVIILDHPLSADQVSSKSKLTCVNGISWKSESLIEALLSLAFLYCYRMKLNSIFVLVLVFGWETAHLCHTSNYQHLQGSSLPFQLSVRFAVRYKYTPGH